MDAVFRSNLTPDIPVNADGDGGFLYRVLAPALDVGGVRYAPAGEPVAGLGPLVFFGVLALASYGLVTLARRGR